MNSRHHQRAAILSVLAAAKGAWVPLAEVASCSEFWGVRIHELRQVGLKIQSKGIGGSRTFFRLDCGAEKSVESEPGVALNTATTDAPAFPEFGAIAPERYPD